MLLHLGVFSARSPKFLVAFTFLLLVIIFHFCRIFHFGRLDAKITVVEQFDFMTVSTQLAFISNGKLLFITTCLHVRSVLQFGAVASEEVHAVKHIPQHIITASTNKHSISSQLTSHKATTHLHANNPHSSEFKNMQKLSMPTLVLVASGFSPTLLVSNVLAFHLVDAKFGRALVCCVSCHVEQLFFCFVSCGDTTQV